jgi:hypothetical protein
MHNNNDNSNNNFPIQYPYHNQVFFVVVNVLRPTKKKHYVSSIEGINYQLNENTGKKETQTFFVAAFVLPLRFLSFHIVTSFLSFEN